MATHATPQATERYASRFPQAQRAQHFRLAEGLTFSSLGLGTYLGAEDAATDARYEQAIARCLNSAVNVLDTSINYRAQSSERNVGRALAELQSSGQVTRDQVIVCTKGGYLPMDSHYTGSRRQYLEETFFRTGIVDPATDVVAGVHCMTPSFLRDQVRRSLGNLGLECIDIYYLHNPETQLAALGAETFYSRLQRAFGALEQEVAAGHIVYYGTATWAGYRAPANDPSRLDLARVVRSAEQAAGGPHHLRFIQLPINLAMPEAVTGSGPAGADVPPPILEQAADLGVLVVASASLLQGRLAHSLPPMVREQLPGLDTDAQRALQFVRMLPVATALVGMSAPEHLQQNLRLVNVPPVPPH